MAVTIYQVAALAGVSPATVSRVLNGGSVSPDYVQRVRDAVETLDYTPNRTARNLRRQESEIIALVIPDIENPFFTALARGVEEQALLSGFSVVLCNTDENPVKEARYLEMALSGHLAGVILAPATAADSATAQLQAVVARGVPVVTVDRHAHSVDVDTVLMDDEDAARRATSGLYDQGFCRVGCITGPADVETAARRADGWREVFRVRTPDANPDDYLCHADYRLLGGRAAMEELLSRPTPPDAVFVANNLMSLGALQQLQASRKSPPEFGLASLGELPFLFPQTDGIDVLPWPARELGRTAASLLLERISGAMGPARTVVIPSRLAAGETLSQ
jgi:LacI family transcriptional regulator